MNRSNPRFTDTIKNQTPAKIISRYLSFIPKTYIPADVHNRIVRGIVSTTNQAAEMMRRELVCYEVVVATIADEAVGNYARVQQVGSYIAEHLDASDASTLRDEEGKVKQECHEEDLIEERESSTCDAPKPLPKSPGVTTLSMLLIKMITGESAHQCRCFKYCEPGFDEHVLQQAKARVKGELEAEVQEKKRDRIQKEFCKEVLQQVLRLELRQRFQRWRAMQMRQGQRTKDQRRNPDFYKQGIYRRYISTTEETRIKRHQTTIDRQGNC